MYPVAVLNSLVQSATGIYVNKQDGEMNSWVLTRRFFYSDCVSYASEVPGSIRYAKDIHLHVEMRETRDGSIFPPYLSVVYAETNHNRSNVVEAVLSVTYEIDPSRHDRAAWSSAKPQLFGSSPVPGMLNTCIGFHNRKEFI
uniref:START domain-containing protein n=1 Tax=Angiostrongylus cantonensis TaxID=6313 RepID=A0A0K0CVZ0_ANGCA